MTYDEMFSIVEDLPFDTEEDIYFSKKERIYLLRPSVLSKNTLPMIQKLIFKYG